MSKETENAIAALAKSEVRLENIFDNSDVLVGTDRFTAMDGITAVNDYLFVPVDALTRVWVRGDGDPIEKIIPHPSYLGVTSYFFPVKDNKREMITIFPDRYEGEVLFHKEDGTRFDGRDRLELVSGYRLREMYNNLRGRE